MRGQRQPRQIAQRRIDIDEFHQRVGALPVRLRARRPNDQRNTGVDLVIRLLAPAAMLAQLPAVVAPENHNRVVREAQLLQLLQQPPDLRVDQADRRVIAVLEPSLLGFRQSALTRIVRSREIEIVAQLVHRVHGQRGRAARQKGIRRQRNLVAVIKLPVFAWRDKGQVRPDEARRQKEGLILLRELTHGRQRLIGNFAVRRATVRHVLDLRRRRAHASDGRRALAVGLHLFAIVSQRPPAFRRPGRGLLRPVIRLVPRLRIGNRVVVDFPVGDRVVAMLHELLRQRHDIGNGVAEISDQIPDLRRIGPQPRHDAGPRGIANRLLAVGAIKQNPARRKGVNVRRLDRLRAITSQLWTQVVHGDEKDIGAIGGRCT